MVDISNKAKTKWHGDWIWADYITPRLTQFADRRAEYKPLERDEMNKYVLIRRELSIKDNFVRAIINITADSRYKLFINGKYVGRGINRCEAYYWYYNTYDISEFLHSGQNIIAIHARFYGQETAYYNPPELTKTNKKQSGKGGVLFEVKLDYNNSGSEATEWIGSDVENTKIIVNKGEKSDVPLKNDAIGFLEEFDSRKMPKNWNELNFDDSKWQKPLKLEYPIYTLLYDENAPLVEKEYYPAEVMHIMEFESDFDEEDLEEMDFTVMNHLETDLEPLDEISIDNEKGLTSPNGICTIKNENPEKVLSIMLKFEKEMVAYPRITIEAPEGVVLDIIAAEKLRDERLGLDLMTQKRGFRLITRGGKQFFEQWDWEGFQYMQIRVRNLNGELKFHKISCNNTHMQVPKKGSFECSDSDLTKLYDACAFTLLCCAIDGYLDCPSREQRSYVGDAYTEALIANTCFGEKRLTKKLIYDAAFGQRKDGITFSFHPGDYQWQCHIIPDYCFYWIQITEDYRLWYGDEQVIYDLYPHFLKAVEWFWKYTDSENGLLGEEVPYWKFIDWSYKSDKPGINAIFNAQFMDVLYIVAKYAKIVGDSRNAEKFKKQADKMKKNLDSMFWDEKKGCYRDYILNGEFGEVISQHTNAYFAIKGIVPNEKMDKILETIFINPIDENDFIQIDELRIKKKPNRTKFDPNKNILVAQPFFMHHINKFLAKMKRFDLMFKYFRRGWVPMLELGKTKTIWETWSQTGSECHAWSATPGYDLPVYVLGILPMEPGFQTFKIEPNLVDLTWAKGSIPTVLGDIQVSWSIKAGEFILRCKIPMKTRAIIKLPDLSKFGKIKESFLNSETLEPEMLNNVAPGEYEIKILLE